MKFIVSTTSLLKQLTSINGVISSNPVVPILENFLFEIEEGKLTITASDLHTSMITELEIESKETGRIAVPARILIDTLRNLQEQPVTFSIDEQTYSVEIISDNGRYKLSGENSTDFPTTPDIENADHINIPSGDLSTAINNTIFATSNDELRQPMTGVSVSLGETNTTFVATDGHRLVRYRRVDITSDTQTEIIIPRKALNLLNTALPGENTNVQIDYSVSNASFRFNNVKLTCRLIDEKYPEYQNVIPVDNNNSMRINRLDLLASLKRIAIYANKTTHQIRFKITGSELVISAEDLEFANEANERLACEHNGDDIEIGFNAKFLIEMVTNLDSVELIMLLSTPIKAGLIQPVDKNDNEDILMLVMPAAISGN